MIPHTDPPASSPAPTGPPTIPPAPEFTIALSKGIWDTPNSNPLYACTLNCHRLCLSYFSFISSLDFVSIPKSIGEAMADLRWRQAMLDEMAALQTSGTWELVPLPLEKTIFGCHWVI